MNRSSLESSSVWYQQFWAWFIFTLPACAIVASLWTVYIAYSGSDDLVVDDYYKDGLAINRQLEKKHAAEQAGIGASMQVHGDDIVVTVSGELNLPRLQLSISHPIEADRDFDVTLQRSSHDQYRARMPATPAPRWHWILEAGPDSSWRLDGAFTASDFSNASSL